MAWKFARNGKRAIGRRAARFLSLLIRLPIAEGHKGIGFLVEQSMMGREAVFVSDPIINLPVISLRGNASDFSVAIKMTKMWVKLNRRYIFDRYLLTFADLGSIIALTLEFYTQSIRISQSSDNLECKFNCLERDIELTPWRKHHIFLREQADLGTPIARFWGRAVAAIFDPLITLMMYYSSPALLFRKNAILIGYSGTSERRAPPPLNSSVP